MDSYFFASFHDNEFAYNAIQSVVAGRVSSELPPHQVTAEPERLDESQATIKRIKSNADSTKSEHTGGLHLPKFGTVLHPFKSRSDTTDSHDTDVITPTASRPSDDGYPPRSVGAPPVGMESHKSSIVPAWVKKPAGKIFGASHNQEARSSGISDAPSSGITGASTHGGYGKRHSVTEVVDRAGNDDDDDSDDEANHNRPDQPRMSFASEDSRDRLADENGNTGYSMMEKSETGAREDRETADKFRKVFALGDKEELLEREYR
jgi:sterol 3beta-glucosyltransferase